MRALAAGIVSVVFAGCAAVPTPSDPPRHPASPRADEAPLPAASTVLAPEPPVPPHPGPLPKGREESEHHHGEHR